MLFEFPGLLILIGIVLLLAAVIVGIFAYKKKNLDEVDDNDDYKFEKINLDNQIEEKGKINNEAVLQEESKIEETNNIKTGLKETIAVETVISEPPKEVVIEEEPFAEDEDNFLDDNSKDYVELKEDMVTTLLNDEKEKVETL